MSGIKPVIREMREAVVHGFSDVRGRLHTLFHNLDTHFDDLVRRIRGEDNADLIPRPETLNDQGRIDWSQAPNDGFTLDADGNAIRFDHVPQVGDRFDRYGPPDGRFVSPIPEDGPFSYDSRSLPYTENPAAYHEYVWTRSPADVHGAYADLDAERRAIVDEALDTYGLTLDDLTSVARGEAAPIPAWGTSGGATQDMLPTSVDVFGTLGMIEEVRR